MYKIYVVLGGTFVFEKLSKESGHERLAQSMLERRKKKF